LNRNHTATTPDNCRHFRCIELAIYAPIIVIAAIVWLNRVVNASVEPGWMTCKQFRFRTITIGVLLNDRDQFVGQPSTAAINNKIPVPDPQSPIPNAPIPISGCICNRFANIYTLNRERISICSPVPTRNPRLSSRVSHPPETCPSIRYAPCRCKVCALNIQLKSGVDGRRLPCKIMVKWGENLY